MTSKDLLETMPATGSDSKSHRGQVVYCQLYHTYLPPSYRPASCQDPSGTYPQWAWSLVNTLFVSATTAVNTTLVVAVIFLWLVNRQFHFKNKHSYDKKPLQPLKKPAKALKKAGKKLKNAAKRIARKRGGSLTKIDGGSSPCPNLSEQNNYKSFQSFLKEFDEEDEDDEAIERSLSNDIRERAGKGSEGDSSRAPRTRAEKKRTRDLLHLASKIEVFSYLSPEAVADILSYTEYVDFEKEGDVVYDTESLDGSMFAVVSGEVTTSLSIQAGDDGRGRANIADQDFSFVSGPGEVITSMLSILTSLVREYQLQDELLNSLIPGVFGGGGSIGGRDGGKIIIPPGMNVRARVTKPRTRLLRIRPRCFVAILEKWPKDVHHVCQTIVARLQRVTLQTLVRFLGLDAGMLGMGANGAGAATTANGAVPEKRPCSKTAEWSKFEQSLVVDSGAASLGQVAAAAASLLGLPAGKSHELMEGASIVRASPGEIICRKGERLDSICLILKGNLEVALGEGHSAARNFGRSTPSGRSREAGQKRARRTRTSGDLAMDREQGAPFTPLFTASPGNWVGLFSCFTHDASFITVRSAGDARGDGAVLLRIPSKTFEGVISRHPRVLIHCLLDIIDTVGDGANLCVSPSMYLLDMALDWMHVDAGEYVSIRGEPNDSMYVVLNGRLRAESSNGEGGSGSPSKREEFGRGATIGELEALAERSWTQSVYAIRHCEVARIPNRIIDILMEMFPSAGIHFARVIASQLHSRKNFGRRPANSIASILPSYALSIATVAVVSLTEEVDISEFCSYLRSSLASMAPTELLTKKGIKGRVGDEFFKHRNTMLKVKMTRILGDVEENSRLVLYESDYKYTWWTKLCVQQADCVLIVVDSNKAPDHNRVEELLAWANKAKNVRCELVVVQSSSSQNVSSNEEHASDNLNNWCERRPWISKQHLVRCAFASHVQDFRRMSRRITGQSVGLVMGGGGARGLAHLGIIKALNEAGVPIDMVGGTSQGAFIGALLARNPDDYGLVAESARVMAADLSSISNKLRDLTFPLTSFFSGHHFNRGIKKVLGNTRIQDFVLNFFCVSVDICNSCQVVHTKGLAWKYVRASMSLTGYLPPISENKRLLADGGYINLVPADVMSDMGAKKIIAVDVSLETKNYFYEYGTELSGLWLLWNSWNPFIQTVKVPSMGDINELLSWVSAERTKRDIIKKADLFLSPPVGEFGTLEYDKIDEIVKIGYDYARPLVREWAAENGYK